jgi:hypothetical protein
LSFHFCFKNGIGRSTREPRPSDAAEQPRLDEGIVHSFKAAAAKNNYTHLPTMAPPNRNQVFGQAMQKRKGGGGNNNNRSNYQRQFGGSGKSSATTYRHAPQSSSSAGDNAETKAEWRRRKQAIGEVVDESFGVEKFSFQNVKSTEPEDLRRRGWLYNVLPTTVSEGKTETTRKYLQNCLPIYRTIYLTYALFPRFDRSLLHPPTMEGPNDRVWTFISAQSLAISSSRLYFFGPTFTSCQIFL